MAYKRNIDRLPIPPSDAQIHNVACHFCIVGCGYKALSWPVDRQGGMQPGQNAFNADLTKQQGAMATAWFSPSMYNIVKQNGRDVHLVVMPDPLCSVNSGLGPPAEPRSRNSPIRRSPARRANGSPNRSSGAMAS
jgi:arsenite oxidase large subunit